MSEETERAAGRLFDPWECDHCGKPIDPANQAYCDDCLKILEAKHSTPPKNEPSGEWCFKTVPTSCGSCHRIGNQKMFLADNCLCLYDDNKRVEEPSKNKGIAAEVCAAMNQHEKLKADNEKLQAEVEKIRKHVTHPQIHLDYYQWLEGVRNDSVFWDMCNRLSVSFDGAHAVAMHAFSCARELLKPTTEPKGQKEV